MSFEQHELDGQPWTESVDEHGKKFLWNEKAMQRLATMPEARESALSNLAKELLCRGG